MVPVAFLRHTVRMQTMARTTQRRPRAISQESEEKLAAIWKTLTIVIADNMV